MATATPTTRTFSPSQQAFLILRLGFALAPVLFGLDKFLGVMTDWGRFLPDALVSVSPLSAGALMGIVGVVEIVAGIGVWVRPQVFAYVVAGWLAVIIVTLLWAGGFLDIALRDLGLLLGALALARLASDHA